MKNIRQGRYQHYKGKFYQVLGVAWHSETLEKLVVYKALYTSEFGRNALWVRPMKMFLEKVKVGAKNLPRFKYVSSPKKGG